jgi:hypothetical protein
MKVEVVLSALPQPSLSSRVAPVVAAPVTYVPVASVAAGQTGVAVPMAGNVQYVSSLLSLSALSLPDSDRLSCYFLCFAGLLGLVEEGVEEEEEGEESLGESELRTGRRRRRRISMPRWRYACLFIDSDIIILPRQS